MRLIDTYSLATGSKIGKPYIYTAFFPLPYSKYITFQSGTTFDSRNYDYWQEAINALYKPLQDAGYTIVQVGVQKEKRLLNTADLRGQTTINQLAYLIKNSSLHFGPDSFCTHLAAAFDVPLVGLFSSMMPTVSGPCFGDKSKQICLTSYDRVGNKKPSYSPNESPKSINLIRPEEISSAISKLLGLKQQESYKTVFVGKRFNGQRLNDFVPNQVVTPPRRDVPLEMRMDIHFDEQMLARQLSATPCIIITDKPINLNLLRHAKPRIPQIIYEITENDNPDFIRAVRSLGLNCTLISYLPKDKIAEKKINYYEIGQIHEIETSLQEAIEKLKNKSSLLYKSNKIIHSDGRVYYSRAALMADIPASVDVEYQPIIDTPEFWKEVDYFYVVEKELDNTTPIS